MCMDRIDYAKTRKKPREQVRYKTWTSEIVGEKSNSKHKNDTENKYMMVQGSNGKDGRHRRTQRRLAI